jgi:hypothetical protein
MVLTAADIQNTDGFCTGFCGWHGWYQFNGQYIKYSFVGNAGTCHQVQGMALASVAGLCV